MKFFYFLFFIFSSYFYNAQTYFNKFDSIGFANGNICVDSDFYYLVGEVYVQNLIPQACVIKKTDLEGNVLWHDTITHYPQISSNGKLLKLDDGFIFCFMLNPDTPNVSSNRDIVLRKYDSSFNILFERLLGGTNQDIPSDIKICKDKGFIISGTTGSFGDLNGDFYLIKTDSLGNVVWEKQYGTPNIDLGYSVDITSDGGYIMGGATYNVLGNYDTQVIKVDSLGNALWLKTFGTNQDDNAGFIIELIDKAYLLTTVYEFSNNNHKAQIIKLDLNGEIIWQKEHQNSSYSSLHIPIEDKTDGTLIFGGGVKNSQDNSVAYILKLDPLGNEIFRREYETQSDLPQYLYDFKPTTDGVYIFCGSAWDSVAQRAWMVKVDCFGCDSLLCYYPDSICDVYDCSLYSIDANFTADDYIINLANIGEDTVTFTNAFGNTTNRVWNFGDGTSAYTDSVVQHAYSEIGTYEVQLIVYHGMCSDTLTQIIEVVDVVGFDESVSPLGGGLRGRIFPNPNKGSFTIDSPFLYDTLITLFNSQGKEVYQSLLKKGKNEFNLNLASGVYILESGVQRERIVIY